MYPIRITRAAGQPEAQTSTYTRDPVSGFLLSETDPLGRQTTYQYDSLGNLLQKTELAGTASATTWTYRYQAQYNLLLSATDPQGHTSRYTYDDRGNLTQVTDPLGHTTGLTYTQAGQIASITRDPGGINATSTFDYKSGDLIGITDPLGRKVQLTPDETGRIIAVQDPLGNSSAYHYDAMDRITQRVDALGNTVQYGYDGNGNLTAFTDARGNTTTWTYDGRNRPLSKTDPLIQTEHYSYDAGGNLLQKTDRLGQTSGYSYDALDRLILAGYGATGGGTQYTDTVTYTWDQGNRLTAIADSLAGSITRNYDDRDNLLQEATPQGTLTYTWDTLGRRLSQTITGQTPTTYTWDSASRLQSLSQGQATIAYTYDAANRRTRTRLANGITIDYTWDKAGQLTAQTYTGPNGPLGDLTYSYDTAGRLTRKGGSLASTALPNAVSNATYDANNRLTDWGTTAITYDAEGHTLNDGQNTYTWNARGQLASIGSTQFGYDGLGRRTLTATSSTIRSYLYDGQQIVREQSGATLNTYLNGPGIDEALRRTTQAPTGTVTEDYLPDHLGGTLALSDPTGAIQTTYTYDPYGNTTSTGAATDNRIQYTGRENDGTGLYYYRARYYSPTLGRFISEDPIGLGGGVNFYAYVEGVPTIKTDPLGLMGQGGSSTAGSTSPSQGSCGCSQSSGSYWKNVKNNYWATNAVIPGQFILPTGVGFATAGITANSIGSITFLQAAGFYGTGNLGGAMLFAGLTTVVSTVAVGGALQAGVLAGSMINSIPVGQCGKTLGNAISDLF